MPATVHLRSGPRGSGKTAALLAEARRVVADDPGAALWLVPTRRCVGELRRRHVTGLRVTTFAGLVDSLVPVGPPLSAAQRRLIAEEVIAEASGELRLYARVAETPGFAGALLGLVDELAEAGPHADDFARSSDDERARLVARFQGRLDRLGVSSEAAREAEAARRIAAMPAPLLEGVRAVFVDGFVDFTPGEKAILDALAARVEAVWISLHDEPGDDRAEMLARPRRTRQHFAEVLPPSPPVLGGRGVGGEGVEHVPGDEPLTLTRLSEPEARARDTVTLARASGSESPSPPNTGARGTDAPLPCPADRPAGLMHLAAQLFRPLRRVEACAVAAGLDVIEAPGVVGEARLVARRIRSSIIEGMRTDDILVVARDLGPYADLLAEVFADYDIPAAVEGTVPLTRFASVGVLLRAARLPDDDFPFAGLTALLRHGHFRPAWAESAGALRAEALLRLIAVPRGADAYLAAVDRWADEPPAGLEDETAEESRRKKTHELAVACRAFLRRLFDAWDDAPGTAPLADHVAWLGRLADDLGIAESARRDPRDLLAWDAFWAEVVAWQRRLPSGETIDRRTFLRRLATVASGASVPRGSSGPGRVRVLSAIGARNLGARAVFLVGLGERGFPQLGSRNSLLSDEDRAALAPRDPLADEMLLFTQIVTGARERLTLSYPAVDPRGQALLPGSFLLAVEACFGPGAIPRERRSMLLDGFDSDIPLSASEYRVRVGTAWPLGATRLPDRVRDNLADAAEVARRRFGQREFTPHDGLFADPLLIDWVGRLFGPERVFSPTALEDYVTCPFRFFMRHLLRLDPLDEPTEEVEVTRRGMTVHRALARLHQRLRDEGRDRPACEVEADIHHEMRRAVDEDIARAPGPAGRALWRLEGERLLRSSKRYNAQWAKFVEPWNKLGVAPRPHLFEADFGLPVPEGRTPLPPLVIRSGGVEVRVSGRIDRVDLAPLDDGLGFWIIDYKTGSGGHYTGPALASFRKLQLTLYALAVEEVFLPDQCPRPLGLAYWLVGEGGSKVALPMHNLKRWHEDPRLWLAVREALREWVVRLATNIRRGAFPLAPRAEDCTATCDYAPACRIGQSRSVGKVFDLPLPGAGGEA